MAEVTDVQNVVANVAEGAAEEATEVAEVVRSLTPREVKFLWGGIGVGLVCGGVTAGLIVRKRLETKYEKISEDEIYEMRQHFEAKVVARDEKPPLRALADKTEDIVEREGYTGPNVPTKKETANETPLIPKEKPDREVPERPDGVVVEEVVAVKRNVFATDEIKDPNENWDYEDEIKLRRSDVPYIIHYDERGEAGHTEASLIYYEGDDVLASETDDVMDQDIVGISNLAKFGHGSPDKSAIFVRYDKIAMEYEVQRNDGNFAEIVHGFMKHSEDFFRENRRRSTYDDD